ncbi:rRNA maturation RNase YbeY [Planctomicrobium piriforme]|uniref:Endoribonuclease YbeY n=1 Tax=Planctomicrobium piriforme TaxID=1576369 RepID=A0A1I3BNE5_9PLAN|nr:rRNA maturation RNase YbeY [Planctomicrobium piriforme]SFH63439.1 probable rRNA maturation factor [Planctomicrobium piriforme]
MWEIDILNEQSVLDVDDHWLLEIVRGTLAAQHVGQAQIDVAVVDDATIHAVNRDHLQHDYPTDVISFVYSAERLDQNASVPASGLRGENLVLEGEILVSAETALRLAQAHGWAPQHELALYVVHGLLHLCGYDDLTEAEQQIMRAQEQAVLKIWNLTPHYS